MKLHRQLVVKAALFASCAMMFILGVWSTEVDAGCKLNVYVKNIGKIPLDVFNFQNSAETGVKSKMGTWRPLIRGKWEPAIQGDLGQERFSLAPGQRKGDDYAAGFGCGAKRRYRITYMCMSGTLKGKHFTDYYPSANDWTEQQTVTIPLGQCK